MEVEARLNISTNKLVKGGEMFAESGLVVEQDAARGTADMLINTVMVMDPSTEKYQPLTSLVATDGTSIPVAILAQTIAAADIVAGDVPDVAMYVGGAAVVDVDMLVLENSLTLDNVLTDLDKTIKQALRDIGIFTAPTIAIGGYENA